MTLPDVPPNTAADLNTPAEPSTPDNAARPAQDAARPDTAPENPTDAPRERERGRGGRRGGRRGRGEGRRATDDATADNTQAERAGKGKRPGRGGPGNARPERQVHPLLEKLAELYPQHFGARFLPLQRGVYEELLARHPEELPQDELKVALGLHARSGRYLDAIASRLPRHNLDGEVVEAVAPEHVHHAIVELHRRRQARTQEDLRPKLIARLADAIAASGLDRAAYTEVVRVAKPEALALIDEAFAEFGRQTARREALQRAFAASGQSSVEAFAEMYGIPLAEARRFLQTPAPAQSDPASPPAEAAAGTESSTEDGPKA